MIDFTAFRHPVLAVQCPRCLQGKPGRNCTRPSEHGVPGGCHQARCTLADEIFIRQHGVRASIDKDADGRWVIDPLGIAADDPRVLAYTKKAWKRTKELSPQRVEPDLHAPQAVQMYLW